MCGSVHNRFGSPGSGFQVPVRFDGHPDTMRLSLRDSWWESYNLPVGAEALPCICSLRGLNNY